MISDIMHKTTFVIMYNNKTQEYGYYWPVKGYKVYRSH